MQGSVLSQVLSQTTIPYQSVVLPAIGILTFIYLVYKAVYLKEEGFVKLLTGVEALVPVAVLMALTLIPGSVMILFGVAEPLITMITQVFAMALIGFTLAVGVAWVARIIQAEGAKPGFF